MEAHGAESQGVEVDIDWVGSTDQERTTSRNVLDQTIVASVVYGGSAPASFVGGCPESQDSQAAAGSPAGLVMGARSDPGMAYGRFFNGTIHEVMIFNRSLAAGEREAVEQAMAARWGVAIEPGKCVPPPVDCDAVAVTKGPAPAVVQHLRAFLAATTAGAVATTLVRSMAAAALAYVNSARARCQGLASGAIPPLRSTAAEKASVAQLAATAASLAAGVVNHVDNTLVRLAATDPVAAQLVLAWNDTAPAAL